MPLKNIAVILVPGIGGSHLRDTARRVVAWETNKVFQMARIFGTTPMQARQAAQQGIFTFRADGPRSIVQKYNGDSGLSIGPERRWQDVHLTSYGPFLTAFEKEAELPFIPHVYAAGYNFFRSNYASASDIASATKGILKDDNIDGVLYVTHSMGALPVRSLLARRSDLRDSCVGAVHVAAPNAGAPEAVLRFARGVSGGFVAPWLFGDAGWKFAAAASVMPAIFELLPIDNGYITNLSELSVGAADPHLLELIVQRAFNTQLPGPMLRYRYEDAKASIDSIVADVKANQERATFFHQQHLPVELFERTIAVGLNGIDTVVAVEHTLDAQGNLAAITETKTTAGDGTVPLASQLSFLPENRTAQVDNVDHADAFKEQVVFDAIRPAMAQLYEEWERRR